ncbi:hypothetical protein J1N35_004243 [Gossypium stocksii]|uniref:Reverse transcriptase zinc-binding domain-containing protein n=1 Tax=Gossypium stocksii TaxID=47602 RepID=A0A9D4AHU6_9ROSI|nr:hypothetical protein J1N35_004243 [Gossypium stocksii]
MDSLRLMMLIAFCPFLLAMANLKGFLPCKVALNLHRVAISADCEFYGLPETLDLILVICLKAREVWQIFGISPTEPYVDFICSIFGNNSSPLVVRVLAILWSIWYALNKAVWQRISPSQDIVRMADNFLQAWRYTPNPLSRSIT